MDHDTNSRTFIIEDNILKGISIPVDSDRKMGSCIFDALGKNPDHVAQIHAESGAQTTCREIKDRSIRCALWMQKQGITSDDIVVVCANNQLDTCIPFFATFFVDAIFNAWNCGIAIHSARRFLNQFKPKFIFASEGASEVLLEASKLEGTDTIIVIFGKHPYLQSLSEILDLQSQEEVEKFVVVNNKSPSEIGAIMLSSGSTGFPKGVMASHKSLLYRSDAEMNDNPGEVSLWYAGLDWISSIYMITRTILKQDTRIITTNSDVEHFFQIVEKYKINYTFVSPLLLNYVAKSTTFQNYDLSSLRTIIAGGSKISKNILEAAQKNLPTTLINYVYGSTEIGGGLTTHFKTVKNIDSIGHILPNYQVKFVDPVSNKILGANKQGELCIKSPSMMMGYYENPSATKDAFDDEGWLRTGDLGYYDDNGELFMVGRLKEIIKYRNYQISPAELEEAIMRHPDVQEVSVIGVPHEMDGDRPAAFVKTKPGSKVTEQEIMRLTKDLEDCKQLRGGVHFMDALPKTGSGKIDKNALKEIATKQV